MQPDLQLGDQVEMIPQARRIFTWAKPTGVVMRKPRNGRRRRLVSILADGEMEPKRWDARAWRKRES